MLLTFKFPDSLPCNLLHGYSLLSVQYALFFKFCLLQSIFFSSYLQLIYLQASSSRDHRLKVSSFALCFLRAKACQILFPALSKKACTSCLLMLIVCPPKLNSLKQQKLLYLTCFLRVRNLEAAYQVGVSDSGLLHEVASRSSERAKGFPSQITHVFWSPVCSLQRGA